jgi:membrane protease subunit HflC
MAERKTIQHWPAIVLGIVVTAIFAAALVTFQVKETELAVVMRFGRPKTETAGGAVAIYRPGLHLRWPYPVESVWRHDGRLQAYELKKGQVEQAQTLDNQQVIVTTYVLWRVGDPGLFLRAVNTTAEAENKLDDVVRNARNNVLGRHALTDLINIDPDKVLIREVEKEILADLQGVARERYGIDVTFVGFKHIGFPEEVTTKVFSRMQEERKGKAQRYRSEGERDAERIRSLAKEKASDILARAEGEAKQVRAEGDRLAAEHYAVFSRNPSLAAFLRKLDALRETVSEQTTLVIDTRTPPYDLLLPGATRLEGGPPAEAGK